MRLTSNPGILGTMSLISPDAGTDRDCKKLLNVTRGALGGLNANSLATSRKPGRLYYSRLRLTVRLGARARDEKMAGPQIGASAFEVLSKSGTPAVSKVPPEQPDVNFCGAIEDKCPSSRRRHTAHTDRQTHRAVGSGSRTKYWIQNHQP